MTNTTLPLRTPRRGSTWPASYSFAATVVFSATLFSAPFALAAQSDTAPMPVSNSNATVKRDTVAKTHAPRGASVSRDSTGVVRTIDPASDQSVQMPSMEGMRPGPLDIPMERTGSGTSWVPDATQMYARHIMAGSWDLMLHGQAFIQYDKQNFVRNAPRGDSQFGSVNWGMLMARRELGGGDLTLRGMVSLEAFTVTKYGYPLLLQSGEAVDGKALHDRQHPHDLFMEIAVLYERPITNSVGISLYVAPVGEPSLGPVAFPHRPSAMDNPLAPLSHHWQDATHISFGVLTAGLFTHSVKLEGSIFNGREPDENRTNFDYKGRSLDSYSGRLTVNPAPDWSVAASYGYLKSPEGLFPDVSLHRVTGSALYGRPFGSAGHWASSLVYGANKESDDTHLSNSGLIETDLMLDSHNTIFGRAEIVNKSARDLALYIIGGPPIYVDGSLVPLPPVGASASFNVSEVSLGYTREIGKFSGGSIGLGTSGTLNIVPDPMRVYYGTRYPIGMTVFLRFRPNQMGMGDGDHAMKGMHM